MKKIVFLMNTYHPFISGNGICIDKIVEIIKKNYEIIIVCQKMNINLKDEEIVKGIKIIRIETNDRKVLNKSEELKFSKNKITQIKSKLNILLIRTKKYLKAHTAKENIDQILVKKYLETLYKINKNDQIDLIIPVCFPFESIIASLEFLKSKHVKIIPFLFDKFSVSESLHRTRFNQKIKMKKHLKIEKKIIEKTHAIIATEDWKNHLNKYFFDYIEKIKFCKIPTLKENINLYKEVDRKKIKLIYAGDLNLRVRNPKIVFEILGKCIKDNEKINMSLYTRGNCKKYVEEFTNLFPNNVKNNGSVSYEVAQVALKTSNILISIGNYDITQTPSKIYEYMSLGKPIIHFYKKKEDPVIKILEKYPMAYCLEESYSDFNKEKLLKFINEYCYTENISFKIIKEIFYKSTPEYCAELFDKIVSRILS